jgi:trimeric autotransporter adhesin
MAGQILKKSHLCAVVCLCASMAAWATEYHGQVFYGGVPVPGATVTVVRGDQSLTTITDRQGLYEFVDLADGQWKIDIAMSGFAPLDGSVTVAPNMPQGDWELKLLGLDQLLAQSHVSQPLKTRPAPEIKPTPTQDAQKQPETNPPPAPPPNDSSDASADGMLINGSENNAATSQFSLSPAFGNKRPGQKGLYNGSIGAIVGNSVFDARPYSLTGEQTPKDYYSRVTTVVTLGGPLRIPRLLPIGPNFFVAYQWTRSTDATNVTGLVPTAAERGGDLSDLRNAQGQPITIYDPSTGLPFNGNIPVSSQASALLALYPQPNRTGNSQYNYQAGVLNNTHADALQSRLNKNIGRRDMLYGGFGFRSSRGDSTNLFNFVDTTNTLGIDTNANWSHRYRHQTFVLLGYHLTRLRTEVRPAFAGRVNVSGNAGIQGNDQDMREWGPPALSFSSGITGLNDANSAFNRNRTDALSVDVKTDMRHHNFDFGGDFRRQEFNEYGQQNPRGTFVFTGAATQQPGSSASTATGSDFADFLLGVTDTSAISYGNPDKYFRQSVYDLYFTDDWRILPQLTVNAGMRWDYGAPISELFGRLANLDVNSGFTSVATVVGSNPKGSVTGNSYPSSLVHPDYLGLEPRIGISWRPIPASTLVVRAGYGIYDDTSVYLSAAESMATQAPFATSLSEANSSLCPLTLANGFVHCAGTTADTFAIDPHLRAGYAQTWQLSAQRDLPWALVVTATYLGTKGTHGMQEFLPNSYAIGATNPCPTCQTGFVYRTSGGNSTRHSGQLQLRRRLRSGFTASLDYTWAKAMDDDAQVGAQGHTTATSAVGTQSGAEPSVAQNWLDLRAERALSTFDQRHLLNVQLQYTTGMGMGGRTLMSGWRGRLLKEWTLTSQIAAGSGLPETPIYLATVPGTGVTGTIRPSLTGADIYSASSGYHLNVNAYAAPATGAWGTARRDSIVGPDRFTLNGSMSRTLRLRNPFNLDMRVDATNLLNHGVYSSWNSVVNSKTFGLPGSVNPMRSMQFTARLRF